MSLRLMFDSDTMGVGLGLSKDLEMGNENSILSRHSQ